MHAKNILIRSALVLLLAGGAIGLSGCLGTVALVVSPEVIAVGAGETIAFSAATVAGTPVTGVVWTITSGSGTIDASTGLYTAPSAGLTDIVTAEIQAAKGSSTGTATVIVRPPLTLVDPIGDAFGAGSWQSLIAATGSPYESHLTSLTLPQTPSVSYDITRIDVGRTATALNITLTLSPVPTLASGGATVSADNLAGFIDLDTDENSATGVNSANAYFCPGAPLASAIGADYFVSLFQRNVDGTFNIYDTTAADLGDATVTINVNTITISLPLTALGGDDGRATISAVVGNGQDPNDCAPGEAGGFVTVNGK